MFVDWLFAVMAARATAAASGGEGASEGAALASTGCGLGVDRFEQAQTRKSGDIIRSPQARIVVRFIR
jgi:hypothetical protein